MTDTQAPPHPFVRPITPVGLEGRSCFFCGHAYNGGRLIDGVLMGARTFVEFRVQPNGADPAVPPGVILTQSDEPGRRVVRHRDYASGQGQAITTEAFPVVCDDCLTAGAHAAGKPPATDTVLNAEREQRERADVAELERDNLRSELDQLKSDVHVVQALERLFKVENEASSTETPIDEPKPKTTRRKQP